MEAGAIISPLSIVTVQFDGSIGLKAAYPTHYTHSGIFGALTDKGARLLQGGGACEEVSQHLDTLVPKQEFFLSFALSFS